ncbi:uncharacterized protein LOC133730393 [Rosa rugosa]|uniref:uncharacterized protein LOC133730393 n=1 Tax=Rosa rugosa TaxID=74645 RepID=UPI002B416C28|nr:uncharacterized protein LOC133730393 [Rosa rugosa]
MEPETSKKGGKRGKKQQQLIHVAAVAVNRQESNPPIRISDVDSNSPDIISPTTTPNTPRCEDETEPANSKRPPRGKAKGDKDFKKKGRVEVEFNARGQPYGEYAAGFSSFLGVTAREFVPITVKNWKDLTDTYREQIWQHITQHYVVHEWCKKHIFRKMVKIWRDHRSLVMKEVMEQAEVVGLPRAAEQLKPDIVDSMEEWQTFVKSRSTKEFREKSERFKSMREKKTLLHRTSRKSFACLEAELKQQSETPDAISRSDVWLCGYEALLEIFSEMMSNTVVDISLQKILFVHVQF